MNFNIIQLLFESNTYLHNNLFDIIIVNELEYTLFMYAIISQKLKIIKLIIELSKIYSQINLNQNISLQFLSRIGKRLFCFLIFCQFEYFFFLFCYFVFVKSFTSSFERIVSKN